MITKTRAKPTSPTDNETLLMAQIRELQHIIEMILCGKVNIAPPALVADGVALVTPKMAVHITGLSRSAIQKLIKAEQVDARWSDGRWFINPATLPRPRKASEVVKGD